VNIRSKHSPLWVPMENLQTIPDQKVFRKIPSRLTATNMSCHLSQEKNIQTVMMKPKKNPFGMTLKVKNPTAKLIKAKPAVTYRLPLGQAIIDSATQAEDAKGQWKLGKTVNRTSLEIQQLIPRQVFEIGTGCVAGSRSSLQISLDQFRTTVSQYRSSRYANESRSVVNESQSVILYQSEANDLVD
jgi:hypothetical protein